MSNETEKKTEKKKSDTKEKVSSRLKEITSSRRLNLEKKPIPQSLQGNEGIKYYFYFLYVFVFIAVLSAINSNLFNFGYLLNLNAILYNGAPLIPGDDLLKLFILDFYSFFLVILGILLRVFVATGLAIIAFDEEKDDWLRLVAVFGIVFIIFGVQIIGP